MSEFDYEIPDESEQLDQLDAADSLIERGVGDPPLDEGIVPTDRWSPAQGFGNTPRRGVAGRDHRDPVAPRKSPSPSTPGRRTKRRPNTRRVARSGPPGRGGDWSTPTTVTPGEDRESELLAEDVGIDAPAPPPKRPRCT